ncbi:hypothetical protein ACWD26_36310 [Streptomyces sp. NPDC002787]
MDAKARQEALRRLDALVGEWVVEADLAVGQTPPVGRSVFEWTLDGQFLVQRTECPDSDIPGSTAIVSVDPGTGAYTQHYFDARGVVRTYAMAFDGGEWRLLRERADFSPLDFRQRFTGRIEDDGDTVRGAWELARGGSGEWERDFGLTYRRSR